MPSSKISELTDGTPAQSSDAIPISRAGVNRRISVADILSIGSGFPALQYLTRTVTVGELNTIFSSPITLLAGTPGAITWVERAVIRKAAGVNTLGGLTSVLGTYPSSTYNWAAMVATGGLDQSGVITSVWPQATSNAPASAAHNMVGTALLFQGSGANPGSMAAAMTVSVWYRVWS